MSDLKLTSADDIDIQGGDFVFASGVDLIAQNLRQRLKLVRGEAFLDTRLGVPYFTQIFGKQASTRIRDSLFKEAVLKTLGVSSLTEYSVVTTGNRALTLSFRVNTDVGPLKLQVGI